MSWEIEVHALRNVDLDIFEGRFVALPEPSGSGKSIVLNILGGLNATISSKARWRDHKLLDTNNADLVGIGANTSGLCSNIILFPASRY